MPTLYLLLLVSTIFLIISVYFNFFYEYRSGDPSLVSKDFYETTPARQLVPRFSPLVMFDDHLIVISAEGAYPESEPGGTLWLNAVEGWLEKGLQVTYVIVGGRNDLCISLASLALTYPGKFNVKFFITADVDDLDTRKIAKDLFVTHPVFLRDSNGNNKAFWLERFHSPESSMAMSVSYVAPVDIASSDIAENYSKKVDLLLAHSEEAAQEDLLLIASHHPKAAA